MNYEKDIYAQLNLAQNLNISLRSTILISIIGFLTINCPIFENNIITYLWFISIILSGISLCLNNYYMDKKIILLHDNFLLLNLKEEYKKEMIKEKINKDDKKNSKLYYYNKFTIYVCALLTIIYYCSTHASKGEFKREVEATGKALHVSLNKDTKYLVTASLASMTTKMQKAEKNGTKIVTYDQFLDIIKNA